MKHYKFDFDYYAKRLDELITVKDEKSISYSAMFLMPELEENLQTAYNFNSKTPPAAFPIVINDAIHTFVRKRVKDGNALKEALKFCENKYLRKDKKQYTLLTSLSFKYFGELPRLNIDGSNFRFYPHIPSKYKVNENKSIQYSFPNYPPKDYTIVLLGLKARSLPEAIDYGLDKINFVRGLWNYSINLRLGARIQSGIRNPINTIRLGPLHTIHNKDGKLSSQNYWFENDCVIKSDNYDVRKKWDYIQKDFTHFRKCIKNSKSSFNIEDFIILYSNSLDGKDYKSALIMLWSLLEKLTDTGFSGYDKTIKRTLNFYNGDHFIKETLEHLRIVRNNFIHKGESREGLEPILFQLKRIVERLILFNINNLNYFNSIQEVGQFLDINRNEKSLNREIQLRKRLIKELYRKSV